jgi:hypothetical protein
MRCAGSGTQRGGARRGPALPASGRAFPQKRKSSPAPAAIHPLTQATIDRRSVTKEKGHARASAALPYEVLDDFASERATKAAATMSPVTFTTLRPISSTRSTPTTMAIPSPGTPTASSTRIRT